MGLSATHCHHWLAVFDRARAAKEKLLQSVLASVLTWHMDLFVVSAKDTHIVCV